MALVQIEYKVIAGQGPSTK